MIRGAILMTLASGLQSLSASDRFHSLFDPQPAVREEHQSAPCVDPAMKKWVVFKEIYLERKETRSPGATYNQQIRRVLDRFTDYCKLVFRDLDSITALELEQYVSRRRSDIHKGKPLQPRTINNEIAILNSAFAYCGPRETRGIGRYNLNLILRPPFVQPLEELDVEPVAVTEEQVVAYMKATKHATSPIMPGCRPQQFWTAVLLLDGVTMLRRGGLLQILRPSDHELLERKQIKMPASINKSRRDEWVSLGSRPQLLELLASLPSRPGEPLLPWRDKNGRPMSLSHFSATMAKFQRAAGIPDSERLKLKMLRSTGATEVGDEFSDSVAKRKLKHGPNTNTFGIHYKSRQPTAAERDASDFLADKLLRLVDQSKDSPPPQLRIIG